MSVKRASARQPIRIEAMRYAPTDVTGVIYLFGRLAARLGFEVECIDARTNASGGRCS